MPGRQIEAFRLASTFDRQRFVFHQSIPEADRDKIDRWRRYHPQEQLLIGLPDSGGVSFPADYAGIRPEEDDFLNKVPIKDFIFPVDRERLARLCGSNGQIYADYLESTHWAEDGEEEAAEILARLLGERTELDEKVINQLQLSSNRAQEWLPDRVKKGQAVLRKLYGQKIMIERWQFPFSEFLDMFNFNFIIYGSLQYGDPVNLDADILLIGYEPDKGRVEKIRNSRRLGSECLIDAWQKEGLYDAQKGNEPHLTVFNLAPLKNVAQAILADPFEFNDLASSIGAAITGLPLFSRDQEKVSLWQKLATEFAKSDPLLSIITNLSLERCLAIRQERATAGL